MSHAAWTTLGIAGPGVKQTHFLPSKSLTFPQKKQKGVAELGWMTSRGSAILIFEFPWNKLRGISVTTLITQGMVCVCFLEQFLL